VIADHASGAGAGQPAGRQYTGIQMASRKQRRAAIQAEKPTGLSRLDIARRLNYHTDFLREVAKSSADIEVAWNLDDIRRSLHFIADHGDEAGSTVVMATAKIFERTRDDEVRRACLESLSRINHTKARNELLKISQNQGLDQMWRDLATTSLRRMNERSQPIAASVNGTALKSGQP